MEHFIFFIGVFLVIFGLLGIGVWIMNFIRKYQEEQRRSVREEYRASVARMNKVRRTYSEIHNTTGGNPLAGVTVTRDGYARVYDEEGNIIDEVTARSD